MNSCVYASNLCYSMNTNDIKDAFGKHSLSVEKVILFKNLSGSSQGKCLIEYKTEQDARFAIAIFDGSYINGRMIHVNSYSWYMLRYGN